MVALFHIVGRADWQDAAVAGEYRPASLRREGFVHCSFGAQVAAVANALYRDAQDLCVIELDPARIGARVVVEDSYGSGTEYPHVYGPIPVVAGVVEHALTRDSNGEYLFTVPGAADPASSDH